MLMEQSEIKQKINEYFEYLDELFLSEYLTEKEKIFETYINQWKNIFNFFKITNPNNFRHENFHSDLISALFDPKTPDIANSQYLNIFVDLLKKKNYNIVNYYFPNSYKVKTEKSTETEGDIGRIDILIYDNEKAIIIENKSNNAGDTDNQLAKYYKYVKEEMGLNILAVIYLTLDPKKEPSLDFDDVYKKYKPEIENVLVILPIIEKDGKDDFVHGFLKKCIDFAENMGNQTALMFLDQLIKLFKYLGGSYMSENLDRDAILEIYADKERYKKCILLANLWNKRSMVFHGIFKELLVKIGFVDFPKYSSTTLHYPIDKYISLGFVSENDNWMFGFSRAPDAERIPEERIEELKILLENNELIDIFIGTVKATPSWVYKNIDLGTIGDYNNIIYNFNKLKELMKK